MVPVVKIGMASCGIAAGAKKVYDLFSDEAQSKASVQETGCVGMCFKEPLVEVIDNEGRFIYGDVDEKKAQQIIEDHLDNGQPVEDLIVYSDKIESEIQKYLDSQKRILLKNSGKIDPENIESYLEEGGYQGLLNALKEMTPKDVIEEVQSSGLRGRGGAGFPTFKKWEFTRIEERQPKYVICNADEGDPGAFMDRSVLESDPHSLLEGMAIAGYAIGANTGYIYIRAEYPLAVKRLEIAIEQAKEKGYLGKNIQDTGFDFDIYIREGAGAFVCGEETALIASIEGKRGTPTFKPPFPAQKGLWTQPSCINNVETLANVPRVFLQGAEAYSELGTENSKGTKVFALAGDVKRGGLIEVPMGIKIKDIVYEVGGGIVEDKGFKAVQIGGPSGGCIPAKYQDVSVDYESLNELGAIMGSGGLLVMDEDTCMVDVAKFFLDFTAEESCGKCTFCRIGTHQMLDILDKITEGRGEMEDIDRLEDLGSKIIKGSLCGLGQTAPNPVLTTLKYFRDEYEAHVKENRCPAGTCKELIAFSITDDCIGCGVCKKSCPVGAISGDKKEIHIIDQEECVKCGMCVSACKFDAIHVVSGEEKERITSKGGDKGDES
ncbi:NADH-quinone oxidoreductase subunit NuoF [Natranaerobius thermophilus]|uniref:NADH dehydrogenase (Quinone) n=1 Tax=Natranaerobius thermophilus (strain ATCC BAA-1301 / DSM 18059 / JW/NM-WN-LF) TaxID=457570 RepID=B2A226_NATTJ|nr:NADH-quinone oxidoreductase subunit NuoF [Natranaerobius thermophilus]ACB84831.1 NADH dehydrogenase (quinone) [Natranaerobius thermophilus JW/NM-WN-LF]